MQTFFGILSFLSFVALIIGLIKPSWIHLKDRKTATTCCGLSFIVLLFTATVITPMMGKFWAVLVFLSLVAIIVGMINPSLLHIKSRKRAAMYYSIGFLIVMIVGVAVTSNPSGGPSGQAQTTNTAAQPAGPQNSQQKLQAAIQSALPPSWTFGSMTFAIESLLRARLQCGRARIAGQKDLSERKPHR
jgi:hypothetical protein